MTPELRRVWPGPEEVVTAQAAYDVERPPPSARPWVGLCMVTSLDGSVAVDGTSGALGNRNDLDVLLTLRQLADVIIVGAGTARGEGYGPPAKPGQRIGVVTNSGRVDVDSPLFASGAGFVIAPDSAPIDDSLVEVLRAGDTRVDLRAALGALDSVFRGVGYVQAEGGPTLNAALLADDLVDELDLTISPRTVGGAGPRLTSGGEPITAGFTIGHLLVDAEHFVFGRWLRART